jgi:hypothetical protein
MLAASAATAISPALLHAQTQGAVNESGIKVAALERLQNLVSASKDIEAVKFHPAQTQLLRAALLAPALRNSPGGKYFSLPRDAEANAATADFRCVDQSSELIVRRRQTVEKDTVKIDLEIEALQTVSKISVTQALTLELPRQSYIVAPGAVYNGNRFLVSSQKYCPDMLTDGVTPNGPIAIVNVPRITADTAYQVELAANALTTPFVGIYDPKNQIGALVEVEIYGSWGVSGVSIETPLDSPVIVSLSLPVHRQRRYRHCDWIDADEPGMTLEAGQIVHASFRVHPVQAANIPGFFAKLARLSFERRDQGGDDVRHHPGLALRTAADLVETKWDDLNWDEALGIYRLWNRRTYPHPKYLLQTGWSGGGTTVLAFLQSANTLRRARARRMLSFLCQSQTASGFFHGGFDGQRWLSVGLRFPECRQFSFVRRPIECGRDLLKAMEIIKARGESVETVWESTARRFLDAVVSTANRFGHLGYVLDPETGEILWGDSSAGVFAIEAMVRGHRWFGLPQYLETARQLAAYYREHFLIRGFTCGGAGDALMAADSESAYGLLAGLVHLHRATRHPKYLAWAIEAADLFQSWILLYDAKLPATSPLGRLGINPRGAVFANAQNQHGAPGIYISSGRELSMLAEDTGDSRYTTLLREIAACIPQMVVRPGQQAIWGDLPPGSVSERLMTMDGILPCGYTEQIDSFGLVALITANELEPSLLA